MRHPFWDEVWEDIHTTHPLFPFKHILAWFHSWKPNVIFDVGANRGIYSEWYSTAFPSSRVYCFEPGDTAFKILKAGVGTKGGAICINKGLSSKSGVAQMKYGNATTGNKIVRSGGDFYIEVTTGKEFCAENDIEHINFLKIDCEGHELSVLDGFDLKQVDFIQVEAGMNPHVRPCVPFVDLYSYFINRGFYLFNIFGGVWEFKHGTKEHNVPLDGKLYTYKHGAPVMRVSDPVFINGNLVELE